MEPSRFSANSFADDDGLKIAARVLRRRGHKRSRSPEDSPPRRRSRRNRGHVLSGSRTELATIGGNSIAREKKEKLIALLSKSSPESIVELCSYSVAVADVVYSLMQEYGPVVMSHSKYLPSSVLPCILEHSEEIEMLPGRTILDIYATLAAVSGRDDDIHRLIDAIELEREALVSLLLKQVDPTLLDNQALVVACRIGNIRIISELLEWRGHNNRLHRVDPSAQDHQALVNACTEGLLPAVNMLFTWEDADPRAQDSLAFIKACERGHLDVLKAILAWRGSANLSGAYVDPTDDDNLAIRRACRAGRADVVDFLLNHWSMEVGDIGRGENACSTEAGKLIEDFSMLILGSSIGAGNPAVICVDPTTRQNACLETASALGHTDVVRVLLDWVGKDGKLAGLRVDATANENAAIKAAVTYNRFGAFKLLIDWTGGGYLCDKKIDASYNDFELYWLAEKEDHKEILHELGRWRGSGGASGKLAVPDKQSRLDRIKNRDRRRRKAVNIIEENIDEYVPLSSDESHHSSSSSDESCY